MAGIDEKPISSLFFARIDEQPHAQTSTPTRNRPNYTGGKALNDFVDAPRSDAIPLDFAMGGGRTVRIFFHPWIDLKEAVHSLLKISPRLVMG